MKDKLITCPHCIYEVKGRCELSGEYVSRNQYCDEADDGEEEEDDEGHDIQSRCNRGMLPWLE